VCGRSPVCVRRWMRRSLLVTNDFPHTSQTTGFSPVWRRWCDWSEAWPERALPHISHRNPVWDFMCACNNFLNLKLRPQVLQWKSDGCCWRVVCWFLMWAFRSPLREYALPQTSHLNGLFPECTILWCSNSYLEMKLLPHTSHLKSYSPRCLFWWSFNANSVIVEYPHTSHTWSLVPLCTFSWAVNR
jgi:hypothetical protein